MTINSKKKKIGFGIIGLGIQGEKMAKAINSSSNATLIGITSSNLQRAKTFAKKHGVKKYFSSYRKLLNNKELGVIIITSPNYKHAAHTLQALSAGKHVLCEKPMALSIKDGQKIKKLAEKNDLVYMVGFHFRHHPVFQKAKSIINSGRLGNLLAIQVEWSQDYSNLSPLPKHMRWRNNPKQAGGGVIMARGIHLFDLLSFLTGRILDKMTIYIDNKKKFDVDTTLVGIARLNGILASILTSRSIPNTENYLVIYGDKAKLTLKNAFTTDGTGKLEILSEKKKTINIKLKKKKDVYQQEIEDFCRAISGQKTLGATAKDGLHIIRAINLAVTSSKL